jgi:hypothetical protein
MRERILASLEWQVSELQTAVGAADDHRVRASLSRSLLASIAELRKSLPAEEAPDPDMISGRLIREAAETGRMKMEEWIRRVEEERAGWPRCPTCGARIAP